MKSLKIGLPLLAAAAVLTAALGTATPVTAKTNTGAVVGGIIAGAAIGAAVSSAIDHPQKVYVPGPRPRPNPWGQSFSPKPGIFCYPGRRACYNARGIYSANWTWTIYAR